MSRRFTHVWAGFVAILVLCSGLPGCAQKQQDPRVRAADDSIKAATDYLVSRRTEDHWSGNVYFFSEADPHAYGVTAVHALLLDHLGVRTDSRDRAIEYLLATQGVDGDWGNPDANLAGVLALKQTDATKYADAIARGESFIEANGESLNDCLLHTQMYYALAGEWSWADVLRVEDGESSAEGLETQLDQIPDYTVYVFLAVQLLKASQATVDEATRSQADDVVEFLLATQQRDGSWLSEAAFTNDVVLALHEARAMETSTEQIKRIDEAVARGVDYLCEDRQQESGYVASLSMPVTDTTIVMRALLESGMSPGDPVMRDGADWLIRAKYPCGGWGFTLEAAPHADTDDSGLCMSVLSATDPEYAARHADYLIGEQSRDGGWAAFCKDFGPLYMKRYEFEYTDFSQHDMGVFLVDPTSPDISAHSLTGLGKVGYGPEDGAVKRAEEYFRAVQFEDGKWYSHWWTGYIYGTAQVVSGLHDAGIDMGQPYVRTAVDWLFDHQNQDGGWGEDVRVIRDITWAGEGDSNAMHTAVAVIALLDAGESPQDPRLQNAVDYLLETQRDDGGWDDDNQLAMYGDPYSDDAVSHAYALWALSAWRQAAVEQ